MNENDDRTVELLAFAVAALVGVVLFVWRRPRLAAVLVVSAVV